MHASRTLLAASLLGAVLCAQAPTDKDKIPKWRIDPYTKNKPEALEKAGYVSFGPFPFGGIADKPVLTSDVDAAIDYIQILWIETKHFRIGTNLPAWNVPPGELETRNKIRAELEELALKLPDINPKTRVLDPWLRAHLTAHRMEKLYTETQELWGVKDEDFPTDSTKVYPRPGARYMGYGPYLGMKDKFLMVVFEKLGPFQAYMKKYLGRDSKHAQRWHFKELSSLLLAIATENDDFPRKHDTALHCSLVFNISQNLLDSFRYYNYDLPVWIREAYAHWHERRVSILYSDFDQNEGSIADMKNVAKWDVYCRGMIANPSKFATFAEVFQWRDFGNITFNDHVAIWSRMDWLMSQGPEKWRKFLFAIKGRVDEKWGPDQRDIVGACRTALQEAYGVSVLDFDTKWMEWVKATYPSQ
ncbi:MAG: hypothetical protein JNK78_03715 [Planctomycetes bacterium]|nr:hypothetical protein [Planctomycetota bacterium]